MNTRNQIKELTLKTLGSPNSKVGQVAAQFTAAIAAIEFPVAQWLNVIEMLLGFMNQGNTQLRVATLQAIGYICESIVSARRMALYAYLTRYARLNRNRSS